MAHWIPEALPQLKAQLAELRGYITRVPTLVEDDRTRRWEEIGQRPGDPDVEMIDIYQTEAGPEEGYGFADYAALSYRTAIVTGWEAFRATLSDLLESHLRSSSPPLPRHAAQLFDKEVRGFARRFDQMVGRYKDWGQLDLRALAQWPQVEHAHELRNAIVHNGGRYTERYAKHKLALPIKIMGRVLPASDPLALNEVIPVDHETAMRILDALEAVAALVHDHLAGVGRP